MKAVRCHEYGHECGTRSCCASICASGVRPGQEQWLAGKKEVVFAALEREGQATIEQDGADAILIGSTTTQQSVEHLRGHARRAGNQPVSARDQARRVACDTEALALQAGVPNSRGAPGGEAALADGGIRGGNLIGARSTAARWLRKAVLAGLALSLLAIRTSRFTTLGLGALASHVRADLHLSTFEVEALTALVVLGAVSVSVPAGRPSDRFGAGRALAVALGV